MSADSPSRLASLLRQGVFCVTAEVVPPRSADPSAVSAQARALVGYADAANVTDNPVASAHMSPVAGAALVAGAGIEPVMQLTTRDRNRLALTSDLLGGWALGARNVLCLTGDPPTAGDHPDAKGVYDLSVLDLVRLAVRLRTEGTLLSGAEVEERPRYLVGVADAPLAPSSTIDRLEEKVDAGAEFVQTQIVFDADAFEAWADLARGRGILERASVLAGVAVAGSSRAARSMRDRLPGVVVPDRTIALLEDAGDDAEEEGLRLAVEVVARLKSIEGIAGIHVMGLGRLDPVRKLIAGAGLTPRPPVARQGSR